MMVRSLYVVISISLIAASAAQAGTYSHTGVLSASPELVAWADGVHQYSPAPENNGASSNALGKANSTFVSLGELTTAAITNGDAPGSITLSFKNGIANGTGWDFAVFENAGTFFTDPFIFAELAYIEVSSNGSDFARFPNVSLNTEGANNADTDIITGFGRSFAGVNTTNVNNLAGIHPTGTGTTFDLNDLLLDPLVQGKKVDLNNIGYVRIVDIPGDGSFLDSSGRPILDAWTTAGTGGHDLDAVGIRHQAVPEPEAFVLLLLSIFPMMCMLRRSRCSRLLHRVR